MHNHVNYTASLLTLTELFTTFMWFLLLLIYFKLFYCNNTNEEVASYWELNFLIKSDEQCGCSATLKAGANR